MGSALTWQCSDTEPFEGGASGGDYQVSDDITVRFEPVDQPNDGEYAFITETYFVEDVRAREHVEEEGEPQYGVTLRIEYLICTDPTDPGGTETSADYDYEYQPIERLYPTVEAALEAARQEARRSIASGDGDYVWDGRSDVRP